jgi:hypothetical protein
MENCGQFLYAFCNEIGREIGSFNRLASQEGKGTKDLLTSPRLVLLPFDKYVLSIISSFRSDDIFVAV